MPSTLRHQPKANYSGLTIVMSNPSRFDKLTLLSGTGGNYFSNECLYPHANRYQCDIRLLEDTTSILPNTKCILALGEAAQQSLCKVSTDLFEQRGSPLLYNSSIPTISSFLPQDSIDVKDYESEFNIALQGSDVEHGSEDDAENGNPLSSKRRHGITKRSNYAFWLQKDTEKCFRIIQNGGRLPIPEGIAPRYHIYPASDDIISLLCGTKNAFLYFDIETDANLNITCFAFSFGLPNIYVVPCIDWTYQWAYSALPKIFQALQIALLANTTVAHNGAGFDFYVLAFKYKIAIGRKVYDTMYAQSRIYPEVEKSLGHCISLPWMFEPYHKNEGNFAYRTQQQAMELWRYCGKDVSSLIYLKKAQDEYAKSRTGLRESIDSVNSYVRPYLICQLQGIHYRQDLLADTMDTNDRLCNQYLRILDILVGKDSMRKIRRKSKAGMPSSNAQCVEYFHNMLLYPVQKFSTKTKKPMLGKTLMYKLKLKFPKQAVIDVILAYRLLAKESGSLKFLPWKDSNKQTPPIPV